MNTIDAAKPEDYLQIDIVSDVVCPWCVIGFKQLEQAIHQTGTPATVKWHPFELNPNMAEDGENLRDHIHRKYGLDEAASAQTRERLTALGLELGFAFNYSDDMRMVNTFRAHQLLHWAGPYGKEHPLKMALFEAYFIRHEDLNDLTVLGEIAQGVGLNPAEAQDVLSDGRFAQTVRQEEKFFTDQGIQGVPAVIFDRRHLVSGAQGVDAYVSILRQLNGHFST
ncbi:frnE protein [Roseibium aquae]|uniref:FrnE protein n=1 Tax=Roseibium aquae TaxID=1323746 RepID=A0A916T6J6_9HYPH|nr:DsbA family oxidoreductase [Roseibium aquae]GGB33617.1 frnE protein [Roseibium aquae]